MSENDDRLDGLEAQLVDQQETIENQQAVIAEQRERIVDLEAENEDLRAENEHRPGRPGGDSRRRYRDGGRHLGVQGR